MRESVGGKSCPVASFRQFKSACTSRETESLGSHLDIQQMEKIQLLLHRQHATLPFHSTKKGPALTTGPIQSEYLKFVLLIFISAWRSILS